MIHSIIAGSYSHSLTYPAAECVLNREVANLGLREAAEYLDKRRGMVAKVSHGEEQER